MRIRTHGGASAILGYCANVHPGESLDSVLHAVRHFGGSVRAELDVRELSFGLWLSHVALKELEAAGLDALRAALESAGLLVCTMNGFPYGNFQDGVVKRRVYHPDLGTDERRDYLLGLSRVLARLLPPDLREGTISTLPIGHREEAHGEDRREVSKRAAGMLCRLCEDLARLHDQTGRAIRICLEPEPGCWLESSADAIQFFSELLPSVARQCGTPVELIERHLGLCYDTCHQAICFEDAEQSIRALHAAGVRIGKVQLSSALELKDPSDPDARRELMAFDEARYLHQVRARGEDESLWGVDDLNAAADLPSDRPWRVHFHVPIHRVLVGRIATTRPFLERALGEFSRLDPVPHLEVETYTWSVLPPNARPTNDVELVRGLAAELRWAQGVLG